MVDGILSRASVERVRVCDERLASTSFYLIDNLPDGRRAYIRVVTLFAKVKLDRRSRDRLLMKILSESKQPNKTLTI
jgi:hypothetical protein